MRVAYSTKLGRLIHGKAEEVLSSAKSKGLHGTIDLIFTSPPFPLNRKKKYGNLKGQEYIEWLSVQMIEALGGGWDDQKLPSEKAVARK